MSLGKKDITKNISSKALIPLNSSLKILNKFIEIILSESKKNSVKISNFGTFYIHNTPIRVGRNPKTKEEFFIDKRSKLSLKVSKNIRDFIN
ncbi:MAG: transcriptional regulator [Candidatus Marinimicrobia bacterium]|nr:transcriptional regulator [Candidatus Neomarinimicrobiota bacterium]|tara:strand:+ start:567 stop:842 length:276 start_codon:yes stop_codon:yes gene_type:complete